MTKANKPERETIMTTMCKAKRDCELFNINAGDVFSCEVNDDLYIISDGTACHEDWFNEYFEIINKENDIMNANIINNTTINNEEKVGRKGKKVICIETNQTFASTKEAAKAFNCHDSLIARVCRGQANSAKDHTFRYIDDNGNILSIPEAPIVERDVVIQHKAVIKGKGRRSNGNTENVLCISTGEIFTSCTDAAERADVSQAAMSRACRTHGAKTNGMKFCYIKDINEHLDEVAESMRKAMMYDEYMSKEERRKELITEVDKHKENIARIESEIARLHEALKNEHTELEKAKENLMYFI